MAEKNVFAAAEAALPRLVKEIGVSGPQILAVAKLLSEGNTIPFIARYRKEAHGNLDEVQISQIGERAEYYAELEDRRATILKSIDSQGKLTDELRGKIENCFVKSELEDLYLPYKPKRRTRAMIARERGLEPLADLIAAQGAGDPAADAAAFADAEKGVPDAAAALAGARDIVAERISERADVRGLVREAYMTKSKVVSSVVQPPPAQPTKFEQYYDFSESIADIPSHRFLAIRRGQQENVLWVHLSLEAEPYVREIEGMAGIRDGSPWAGELRSAVRDAYERLVAPSCELDAMVEKKLAADRAAVEIFAENLRHLLLAAPLGEKTVLAIDPGIRTGCKCALLDATGKYVGSTVIYPQQRTAEAQSALAKIVEKYKPEAIAVGNGTAGRETEAFVRTTLKLMGRENDVIVVSVSESGASVYSASEVARAEFPKLDLTVRGAISIGRRLQDPLAELVKIDPKAIGVGQYQHDVHQPLLGAKLDEVVVSCVNRVGVELNTASASLLTRVSGLGASTARKIVEWRDGHGAFKSRKELLDVPGLGPKAFEQCAGFLRIRGAENPLDASAVHPERYALVERMAADMGVPASRLAGDASLAAKIDIRKYISNDIGEPTLRDIVEELKKPGRDPRAVFEKPAFRDDIMSIEDVREGMELEGVVTNVTAFGAFVDIGVHQDGLVHVSEIADRFVRDPAEVVKAGDRIKVKVLSVDLARKRISLTARKNPRPPAGAAPGGRAQAGGGRPRDRRPGRGQDFFCNPFANL